ncbi:hypothetical protein TNCV_5117261 [Trichonephila clavipes]|nr:hypothetical protein TNCV_5117261 [Trichonephila clavipes]
MRTFHRNKFNAHQPHYITGLLYDQDTNFRPSETIRQRTYILGGDQGYTPEIIDEILTTARDLELKVNEDDVEGLIKGHKDELTEELQEILNEEHQET